MEDLYDPFNLLHEGEDALDDPWHQPESKWDTYHIDSDEYIPQIPSQQPQWYIESQIRMKWNDYQICRLESDSLDEITHSTIHLHQQHTEIYQFLNPYPMDVNLFDFKLYFINILVKLIKSFLLSILLKFNPNDFIVVFYTFAFDIGSRLPYILVEFLLIDHAIVQVELYNWLFGLFFNWYFLIWFCICFVNFFWFTFWFFIFFHYWINCKCKVCGYYIYLNRLAFVKTKVKDR